ncbi:hypothetical protein [Streptomyces sp. 11x1]|uniref:hypothetical protein n=1 Tax=Streptomyces sp. 11x1 TaxID=3038642 RepID=UPI00292E02E1|nr:hypothetical protein [Streptomyces sp. 11x1]WNZ10059.1 hypothetical protein P8T65_22305 [Streptomyces sp. 11x1]
MAVAALCGASTKDEALRVITTLPGLPAHQTAPAAAWLASLYPADGDRYWGSLQPDRIAEYHASRTLTEDDIPLPALLGAATPGQQAQLITVLARAAIAHYNTGRTTASEQVLHTLDTALDTAPLTYQGIRTAADALPYPSRVIAPLALRLTVVLAHTHQQLAEGNPAAYEPDLATSLAVFAMLLAAEGDLSVALRATGEAVELYRSHVVSAPSVLPRLHALLGLQADLLDGLGREAEAEAVRRWLGENPRPPDSRN